MNARHDQGFGVLRTHVTQIGTPMDDRRQLALRDIQQNGHSFGMQGDDGIGAVGHTSPLKDVGGPATLSGSDVAIHALRQPRPFPAQLGDGQLECIAIGHSRDIFDGDPKTVVGHRGRSWNALRALGVILDQRMEDLDHGTRLCQRGRPYVDAAGS